MPNDASYQSLKRGEIDCNDRFCILDLPGCDSGLEFINIHPSVLKEFILIKILFTVLSILAGYKGGEIVLDSAVVTGNMSKGNGTPDGVFSVKYKQKDALLQGEGYASPVDFFVVFASNVGFHDADRWRSEYGGEIYQTSGSHGCVNMPRSKVQKLYKIVEEGTPVVTYYRDKVKLTSHNALVSNAYSYAD